MRERRNRNPVAPGFDSHALTTSKPKKDWSEFTVADLKAEAARQGLSIPSKTLKADIVAALEKS